MSTAPLSSRKQWWLTHKKVVDRHTREARALLATQQPGDAVAALDHLEAALEVSPRSEAALEMKARALLSLRRFKDVADMLQNHIPSIREAADDGEEEEEGGSISTSLSSSGASSSSSSSSQQLQREKARLLPPSDSSASDGEDVGLPRCLSVSDLRRRVLCGLPRRRGREGHWRYMVLGQACSHLGMLEDAMLLLQTGRRLTAASCRRECHDLHDDSFSDTLSVDLDHHPLSSSSPAFPSCPAVELEAAAALLNHIKLLLRRRAAAHASLDAGLSSDSVRHFSKILDSRRAALPHLFAAACLLGRSAAHRSSGRFADAIADCNRTLAIDPSSIPALRARADLLESVGSLQDSLRDLHHLKLLYDAILWDRKLPGPPWRPRNGVRYREIPGSLRAVTSKIHQLRQRVARGEGYSVDYYALFGLKKGCTRSELERAHLLLSLKHKPDKASQFVDRLEFADDNRDLEVVRDEARMSASILYRLLQKGHSSIMARILEEERAATKCPPVPPPVETYEGSRPERKGGRIGTDPVDHSKVGRTQSLRLGSPALRRPVATPASSAFQGVFCRDLAVVSSLIRKVGCSQPIPAKYEALSC